MDTRRLHISCGILVLITIFDVHCLRDRKPQEVIVI